MFAAHIPALPRRSGYGAGRGRAGLWLNSIVVCPKKVAAATPLNEPIAASTTGGVVLAGRVIELFGAAYFLIRSWRSRRLTANDARLHRSEFDLQNQTRILRSVLYFTLPQQSQEGRT